MSCGYESACVEEPGPQGTPGLNWRDAWDATVTYAAGDGVSYQGSSYRAKTASINVTPDTAPLQWSIVAQSGSLSQAGLNAATAAGQAAGQTAGAASGATAGAASGQTAGATAGATAGQSAGSTAGQTAGANAGSTAGATAGTTAGTAAANAIVAPIANGTATDAGTLTGAETVPLSRSAGLLQTTIAKIVAFIKALWLNMFLIAWTNGEAFTLIDAVRDLGTGAIITAEIQWPDGTPGVFTTDTASTAFPGAIDAYHVTYVGTPSKTITQAAVTRDANGAVTVQPALTIA